MTTGRRQRHPWGISAEQLSHALGHGDGAADSSDADDGGRNHNRNTRNDGEAQQLHRPIQAEEEEKEGPHDEMHANETSRGATGSGTCNTSSRSNVDEGADKAKAKVEVAEFTGTDSSLAADDGRIVSGQDRQDGQAFDVIPARPRPSADANTSASPSSAERFSYGFDDSASENDNDNESTTTSKASDDKERNRSDAILSARGLAQQALETQQQRTQEVPISSPSMPHQSPPAPTQRVAVPPSQVPAADEQLALSLLARERKQLQKRRAQAKADERMAREVQSQLDRLSFVESITSSVGDDEEATNRKEKRRQSIEADAKFATLLSSMEDTNMELLRRQRQQQEESDLALARAEQERDQFRHGVKHSSASGGTANADSTTASLSSAQQIQIDELLARTEAARDEIRLELRNRAVEHDEAVARAEQARERAARDVTDEAMAQTLQEEHIRDHWQQGQEYVPPRPQEEVGQVQTDSL